MCTDVNNHADVETLNAEEASAQFAVRPGEGAFGMQGGTIGGAKTAENHPSVCQKLEAAKSSLCGPQPSMLIGGPSNAACSAVLRAYGDGCDHDVGQAPDNAGDDASPKGAASGRASDPAASVPAASGQQAAEATLPAADDEAAPEEASATDSGSSEAGKASSVDSASEAATAVPATKVQVCRAWHFPL